MATREQQLDYFYRRTAEHILRVQRNVVALICSDFDVDRHALLVQARDHDRTKYEEPEFSTYVELTWMYRCQKLGEPFVPSEGFDERRHTATLHHVTHNPHHPEFYAPNPGLNPRDRDAAPAEMVDATAMTDVGLVEMCCDWVAMAQELSGSNSAHEWARKNINVRWRFTDDQVARIYETLDCLQRALENRQWSQRWTGSTQNARSSTSDACASCSTLAQSRTTPETFPSGPKRRGRKIFTKSQLGACAPIPAARAKV
ncbi:MAG: hypothetical protein D6724_08815 [Armatimonadetes bacterium]|nr:MAG: hypothetical protein D6724_08815 [Armatimonadota bacterium]